MVTKTPLTKRKEVKKAKAKDDLIEKETRPKRGGKKSEKNP